VAKEQDREKRIISEVFFSEGRHDILEKLRFRCIISGT
jgi:hypothetical protein